MTRFPSFLPLLPILLVCSGLCATFAEAPRVLDLDGRPVDPFAEHEGRLTVLLFTRIDCPISNRYAPEVKRIHEAFAPRGVVFHLVYVDADETAQMIRDHIRDYGYSFTALRDPEHVLVRRAEATVTPEAAVFSADGRLVYRGRIDDWYAAFGKSRPAPTELNLRDALEAALAGRDVAVPRTKAIGCFIPDPR